MSQRLVMVELFKLKPSLTLLILFKHQQPTFWKVSFFKKINFELMLSVIRLNSVWHTSLPVCKAKES